MQAVLAQLSSGVAPVLSRGWCAHTMAAHKQKEQGTPFNVGGVQLAAGVTALGLDEERKGQGRDEGIGEASCPATLSPENAGKLAEHDHGDFHFYVASWSTQACGEDSTVHRSATNEGAALRQSIATTMPTATAAATPAAGRRDWKRGSAAGAAAGTVTRPGLGEPGVQITGTQSG